MATYEWPVQGGGSGNIVGPGSSTDNSVPRFDGITGELLQDSGVIIDDSNNMSGVASLTVSGLTASRALTTDGSKQLTSSATTATELGYVSGVTSAIQTQLDGKQASDADLTALAGLSTTGIIVRTGAGTASTRTVTGTSNRITVSNGDGVSGDPILDIGTDVVTLAGSQTLTNKTITSPSGLVKADVGLGSVDNTSDANKPVSSAQQTALDLKANIASPTFTGTVSGITASMVGLGNVDNTSDATKNAATATLTNKDFDGGTASNTSRITVPKDTYANLLTLTRKEGTLLYATDLDTFFADDGSTLTAVGSGSGSGTGEKNYIENSSALVAITGWTSVNDLDVARTTTAADLPREYTTGTGIKITADSNTQSTADYVYYDFTLDDVDLNKKLKIEWSQKQTGSYVASNLAVVITTQADRTTALHTPVTTNIPAVDGVFTTSFDAGSTATLSLVIRATTDMATDAGIVISDVVVGPGTIVQGAAVSEWASYTPTATNVTTSATAGRYRRVGSSMEVDIQYTASAQPSGVVSVSIPSGYTIDSNALATGVAQTYAALGTAVLNPASGNFWTGTAIYATSTTLKVVSDNRSNYWNATIPYTGASGDKLSLRATIPIAEWAGNGTVNLGPGAQVEYAYNSSTSNSDDTTSFAYGPSGGSLIGSTPTAGGCTKRVRFQYPIQSDDLIVLEVSPNGDGKWFQLPTMDSGAFPLENLHQESTEYFGLGIYQTAGLANNEIAVKFGRYPDSHTTDSSGYTWSQLTAYKWRIRKCKASAPVGFGLAGTDGSSGLYKAGQAPGLTTGAAISAGYIGEVVTSASITATALSTSYANITNASLALSAGIWQICYSISLQPSPGSTVGNETLGSVQLYNSTGAAAISGTQRTVAARNPASASFYVLATAACTSIVNVSSATTYTIQGKRTDAAGTGTCQLLNSVDYTSSFYAVRIA